MSLSDDERFRWRNFFFGVGAEILVPAAVALIAGLYIFLAG